MFRLETFHAFEIFHEKDLAVAFSLSEASLSLTCCFGVQATFLMKFSFKSASCKALRARALFFLCEKLSGVSQNPITTWSSEASTGLISKACSRYFVSSKAVPASSPSFVSFIALTMKAAPTVFFTTLFFHWNDVKFVNMCCLIIALIGSNLHKCTFDDLWKHLVKKVYISKSFIVARKPAFARFGEESMKKAIWRILLSIQSQAKAISLVTIRSKELRLVQENHATVKLDLNGFP